jgi:hypothetical protein
VVFVVLEFESYNGVGNIVFIDVKVRGRLQMHMINITSL